MAIYFTEKMSNQQSLFLSRNDPRVRPTEVTGDTSVTLIKPLGLQAAR